MKTQDEDIYAMQNTSYCVGIHVLVAASNKTILEKKMNSLFELEFLNANYLECILQLNINNN